MIPFPRAVQDEFPCGPSVLPDRPWWSFNQDYRGVPRYRRNDYIPTIRDEQVHIIHPTAEEAAQYDAHNPIPHPGYRAGQVWAAEDGTSRVVLGKVVDILAISTTDSFEERVVVGWPTTSFAQKYYYLMADPACPHLAPWSPAQKP